MESSENLELIKVKFASDLLFFAERLEKLKWQLQLARDKELPRDDITDELVSLRSKVDGYCQAIETATGSEFIYQKFMKLIEQKKHHYEDTMDGFLGINKKFSKLLFVEDEEED